MKLLSLLLCILFLCACDAIYKKTESNKDASTNTDDINNIGVCGTYIGNLPPGEFKALKGTLVVNADSNCMITCEYDGIDTKLVDKGRWRFENNILTTTLDEVQATSFKLIDNKFIPLDAEGNEHADSKTFFLIKQ